MPLNSTVISLVPFDIREEKPGLLPPRYFIPASDMKIPSLLKVGTASHYVYLDQDRGSLRVSDPSNEVARSIVEDYVTSQLGVDDTSKPALFWVDDVVVPELVMGKYRSTVNELLEFQKNWFTNVARLADNDWIRYHQHNVVSDFQRDCAKHLGWDPDQHEWMAPRILDILNCPACGSPIQKNIILCPNCKLILNEQAAKEKNLKFATL